MHDLLRTTALAALIAAGASSAALAQAQPARESACWSLVASHDANRDGVLDTKELASNKDPIFIALDRNRDRFLARDEYEGCLVVKDADAAGMQQAFAQFDRDKDQRISKAEFTTGDAAERTNVVVMQQAPQVTVQQQPAAVAVEQRPPQVNVQQAQPTVQVEQQQPVVTVRQPQPEITVQQPPPKVTVEQAEPKVTVQTPEPRVTVQQAQPQVRVEQAQPRVQVQQAEPKVSVQQAEPKVQVEQAQPRVVVEQPKEGARVQVQQQATDRTERKAGEDRTAAVAPRPRDWNTGRPIQLGGVSLDQLIGRDVVNLRGNEIGEIEDVVVSRDDRNAAFAIISVGGFLGIGDKDIALPFDQLRMDNDRVLLMSEQSERQLKSMPAYDKNRYTRPAG